MNRLVPSKKQWNQWSLPSQLTAIGTGLTVVSILYSILSGSIGYLKTTNAESMWYVGRWKFDLKKIEAEIGQLENQIDMHLSSTEVPQKELFYVRDHYLNSLSKAEIEFTQEKAFLFRGEGERKKNTYSVDGFAINSDQWSPAAAKFELTAIDSNSVLMSLNENPETYFPGFIEAFERPDEKFVHKGKETYIEAFYHVQYKEYCHCENEYGNMVVKNKFIPNKLHMVKLNFGEQ